MGYPFGKDFTFYYFPLADNEGLDVSEAMQTQTPAIYVYDSMPSRADAQAGSGSPVQSVTSWTWDAAKLGWSFTIDAIDDPDPTSGVTVRTYWIAINFRLDASEQLQLVLRSIDLERVSGHTRPITVGDDELSAIFPQVTSYSSQTQRWAYVSQATEEVKAKLRARGYEWALIHRPDRLEMAIAYKTLAMVALAQIQQPGDKFAVKYAEWKGIFQDALESVRIEYDSDNDGDAETIAQPVSLLLVVR